MTADHPENLLADYTYTTFWINVVVATTLLVALLCGQLHSYREFVDAVLLLWSAISAFTAFAYITVRICG